MGFALRRKDMEGKKEQYLSPSFTFVEEEAEYWGNTVRWPKDTKGIVRHKQQRRSFYLALRFSSGELKQLRDAAQQAGIGPTILAGILVRPWSRWCPELVWRQSAVKMSVFCRFFVRGCW